MERVKRIAWSLIFMVAVTDVISAVVFSLMKKDALDKMLAMQEVLVIQGMVAGTAAVQNLVNANFQGAEENLYRSLGLNMVFLKQIYDKRGRLPEKTIALLVRNVSQYQKASELSRDKRFENVFNAEMMEAHRNTVAIWESGGQI